jgi:hypothetical protein
MRLFEHRFMNLTHLGMLGESSQHLAKLGLMGMAEAEYLSYTATDPSR